MERRRPRRSPGFYIHHIQAAQFAHAQSGIQQGEDHRHIPVSRSAAHGIGPAIAGLYLAVLRGFYQRLDLICRKWTNHLRVIGRQFEFQIRSGLQPDIFLRPPEEGADALPVVLQGAAGQWCCAAVFPVRVILVAQVGKVAH